MKQFKTLTALVLALMMIVGTMGLALAETTVATAPTSGSIKITNAAKGETYKIFKIFDAKVAANGGITYQGTIPDALSDYFTTNSDGNIVKADGKTDPDIAKAVADYVATLTTPDDQKIGEGTPVVFSGLSFGYYGVTSSQGAVVTVDSNNPDVEIIDKNNVVITAQKKVNGKDVEDVFVGETVTFTAKFGPLPNFIGDEQVQSFTIDDTLPEYLTNVAITSIIIYNGDPDAEENAGTQIGTNSATAFSNKKILIPWVNDADPAANIYPNKSYIKVTYTAKIGEQAVIDGDGNRNDVGITPNKDKTGDEPFEEHVTDHAEVKTYGAALIKVDGTDNTKALQGAKFTIDGFEVEADPNAVGVYRITGSKTTGASIEMSTDEQGVLYILGVKDNLTVTETEAPAGYNKIAAPFTLSKQVLSHSIWTKAEDRYFDAHGNLVSSSSSETTTTPVQKNYTDLKPEAQKVENNTGAELPSTGGIGTTIFYIAGIVMVLGAAAIVIARRKAEQE